MLRTFAVTIVILASLVGAVVSPFYGLLAYLWFAIFRPQEWVWFDLGALHLSLVIGVLLIVRSFVSGTWPVLGHRLAVAMILFWLTGLLAQLNAVNPELGWTWVEYTAKLFLVSLLMVRLLDTPLKFVLTVATIAASFGFYTAKAGVAFIFSGGTRFSEGLAGAFIDNNGYALGAIMVLPFLLATARMAYVYERRKAGLAFLAAVPLTALTVIGTYSRAGLLGFVSVCLVALALARKRLVTIVALTLLAAVALPFVALPHKYVERMETITTYQEVGEESAISRLHFWSVALRMAEDQPLGVGLRNYDFTYDRYDDLNGQYGRGRAVHNSHLEVLAENGYAGFLLWLFLLAESLRVCLGIWRRARRAGPLNSHAIFFETMAATLLMSMTGFLVSGAFIALSLNDLTWLSFGLVIALERLERRANSDASHRVGIVSVPESFQRRLT